MTSPNLGLTELANAQAQYLSANESFAIIDAILQTRAINKALTAPPVSPVDGDVYIMASAWAGITLFSGGACAAGDIAVYRSSIGAFKAIRPKEGWKIELASDDTTYRFDGAAWQVWSGGGGGFTGGTLTSALNEAPPATLASAASVAIGAAAANTVNITGTTTITSFDTIAAGATRRLIFAGALTLTHNATSLILPTGANITTAAGDVAEFMSLGSGNWKCVDYVRANGQPLAGGSSSTLTQSASSSSGTLDLSATTVGVILVTLTENIGSIALPAGVAGQSVECRIMFTQGGAGNYTVSGWAGVTVEGGGSAPAAATGAGAVTAYVLANDNNTGWRMYLDASEGLGNRVINGDFSVNQLNPGATSGTVTLTAGQYGWAATGTKGFGRWKAGASGCTYSFSVAGGVTTITITAGSLQQVIEGISLQSGTHVLSWSGTAQGKIGAGSYSASGVTGSVTGGSDLTIEFGTGTLSQVQFEPGVIATPFKHRLPGTELSLCERYYEVAVAGENAAISFDGNVTSGNAYSARVRFATAKRAVPTITVTNAAAFNFPSTTGTITAGTKGFSETRIASASGLGNFQSLWTASAEL